MIDCAFLPVVYQHHHCVKERKPLPDFKSYDAIENVWLSFYGLGRFETYQFLYVQCTGVTHLQEWLIQLKGAQQVYESAAAFREWMQQKDLNDVPEVVEATLLTKQQLQNWDEQGYIKVGGLINGELCDAVTDFICAYLEIDISDPSTWYKEHPDWHGLMLQLYQHESIQAIRMHPAMRQLFAELYNTNDIIAQTDKVSFNPPETASWKFAHNVLHWDIDFSKRDRYYIQGLVYLNDVPENRGPLTLVPGFHHQFENWIKTYPDVSEAHQAMRKTVTSVPVPGQKGDIILWQQTLPHAASANHSDLPRFVQYVSFAKL